MGGGFGALAAMNEAIKKNREMLKGKKERKFEKDPHYFAKRGEALVVRAKPLSPEERTQLIQSVTQNQKADRVRRIIVLALAALVTFFLVQGLLSVFHFYVR